MYVCIFTYVSTNNNQKKKRVVSTKLDIKSNWIASERAHALVCVCVWDAKNEKLHAVAVAVDAYCAGLPVSPVYLALCVCVCLYKLQIMHIIAVFHSTQFFVPGLNCLECAIILKFAHKLIDYCCCSCSCSCWCSIAVAWPLPSRCIVLWLFFLWNVDSNLAI